MRTTTATRKPAARKTSTSTKKAAPKKPVARKPVTKAAPKLTASQVAEQKRRIRQAEAVKLIEAATDTASLRKGYAAYIGRRQSFCVLGPEYFGCFNTGNRARIYWKGDVGFVGTENEPHQFFFNDKKKAISKFLAIAIKVVRFNVKQRTATQAARATIKTAPVGSKEYVEACLTLSDNGLL